MTRDAPKPCEHPADALVAFMQVVHVDIVNTIAPVAWCSACGAHQVAPVTHGRAKIEKPRGKKARKPKPLELEWRLPGERA